MQKTFIGAALLIGTPAFAQSLDLGDFIELPTCRLNYANGYVVMGIGPTDVALITVQRKQFGSVSTPIGKRLVARGFNSGPMHEALIVRNDADYVTISVDDGIIGDSIKGEFAPHSINFYYGSSLPAVHPTLYTTQGMTRSAVVKLYDCVDDLREP